MLTHPNNNLQIYAKYCHYLLFLSPLFSGDKIKYSQQRQANFLVKANAWSTGNRNNEEAEKKNKMETRQKIRAKERE